MFHRILLLIYSFLIVRRIECQSSNQPVVYTLNVNLNNEPTSRQLLLREAQTAEQAANVFVEENGIPLNEREEIIAQLVRALEKDAKAQDVKLLDAFSYNGEPIIELRLSLLYDIVDEFIIVEAKETHSGKVKPELYIHKHASVFEKYADKITYIVIESFADVDENTKNSGPEYQPEPLSWNRENFQRNIAAEHIKDAYKDQRYIVLVCDADEIPIPGMIKMLPLSYMHLDTPAYLGMWMYYYHFGWQIKNSGCLWDRAFIINDRGILSDNSLSFSRMRVDSPCTSGAQVCTHCYLGAGWHGSYFFNIEGIRSKLDSFAHVEYQKDFYKDAEYLRECIRHGRDLFSPGDPGRNPNLVAFDTNTLPKELQRFNDKLMFLQEYST